MLFSNQAALALSIGRDLHCRHSGRQAAIPTVVTTIKMIVPFVAGGGTDVLARIIAQASTAEGATAESVVENQPGASGAIGTRAVMKAVPDGYTLLMASTGALMTSFLAAPMAMARSTSTRCSWPPIVIGLPRRPHIWLVARRPTLPVNSDRRSDPVGKVREAGRPEFPARPVSARLRICPGLLFASETDKNLLHVALQGIVAYGLQGRRNKAMARVVPNLLLPCL